MKKTKKVIIATLSVILIWVAAFAVDYFRVIREKKPVFCIGNSNVYSGLGYEYELIVHPITGKQEYVMYLFGEIIKSNVTN